jgi:hypothetical protein
MVNRRQKPSLDRRRAAANGRRGVMLTGAGDAGFVAGINGAAAIGE